MASVVKTNNVAARAMLRILRVLRDRPHSLRQPFNWLSAPVAGNSRPHHGLHAEFACGADHPRIAQTVWRAKVARAKTNRILQRFLALAQLAANSAGTKPKKVWMRLRVIAEHMSSRMNLFCEIRTLLNKLANHKKS